MAQSFVSQDKQTITSREMVGSPNNDNDNYFNSVNETLKIAPFLRIKAGGGVFKNCLKDHEGTMNGRFWWLCNMKSLSKPEESRTRQGHQNKLPFERDCYHF